MGVHHWRRSRRPAKLRIGTGWVNGRVVVTPMALTERSASRAAMRTPFMFETLPWLGPMPMVEYRFINSIEAKPSRDAVTRSCTDRCSVAAACW